MKKEEVENALENAIQNVLETIPDLEKDGDSVECNYKGTIIRIPKKQFLEMAFRMQLGNKKFVRYKEGAIIYGMSQREFYKLAHDADAVYKRNSMALVNTEILDRFMESYRG